MQKFKRLAAVSLAAATIATGATAVVASPAEAKIASGKYWYHAWNARTGEHLASRPARISGNRIYVQGVSFRIHSTPRGGYYEEYGMRSVFWRTGQGYVGRRESVYAAPLRLRLTPR